MVSLVLAPIVTLTSLVLRPFVAFVDDDSANADDRDAAFRQFKTNDASTQSQFEASPRGTPYSRQAARTKDGAHKGSVGGSRLIDIDDALSKAEIFADAASGLEVRENAPES
jgi:hypothetical protein